MNRMSFARVILASVIAALPIVAQTAAGDLAVVGVLTPQLRIVRAGVTTTFPLGSLGGSNMPFGVVADPNLADSFLIFGTDFIGRATITGATTASYTQLTGAAGAIADLSWDGASFVAADINAQQIVRIDPVTFAVTPVTSGPQPWGSNLGCATVDPATGRIFAGGQLGVWVVPTGASVAVPYASGWSTSSSSYATGIAMDVPTGDPVVTLSGVNRVVRIPSSGTLIDLVTSGPAVSGPTCIDVDVNGDFVVGGSFGGLWRVARAGGAATSLGTASGIIGAASGVAVVKPLFRVLLTPTGGGAATLGISGVPLGTVEGWMIPSLDVSQPVGAGAIVGMNPDSLSFFIIASFPTPEIGGLFHWVGGVPPPFFPATAAPFAPGFFPGGFVIDVIALAVNAGGGLTVSPVHRASF